MTYFLLDTTRAYAREKLLSSDESGEISRRHAAYVWRDNLGEVRQAKLASSSR